ncbi:hypothetical protein GCM10009087_53340 [Sphingomonas oligophenolica]
MPGNRSFDCADERREGAAERGTRPLIESRFVSEKEIVDRNDKPVIGAQIRGRRASEQLADPPVGAIIHVAVIARHAPRLRDLSLRRA